MYCLRNTKTRILHQHKGESRQMPLTERCAPWFDALIHCRWILVLCQRTLLILCPKADPYSVWVCARAYVCVHRFVYVCMPSTHVIKFDIKWLYQWSHITSPICKNHLILFIVCLPISPALCQNILMWMYRVNSRMLATKLLTRKKKKKFKKKNC